MKTDLFGVPAAVDGVTGVVGLHMRDEGKTRSKLELKLRQRPPGRFFNLVLLFRNGKDGKDKPNGRSLGG